MAKYFLSINEDFILKLPPKVLYDKAFRRRTEKELRELVSKVHSGSLSFDKLDEPAKTRVLANEAVWINAIETFGEDINPFVYQFWEVEKDAQIAFGEIKRQLERQGTLSGAPSITLEFEVCAYDRASYIKFPIRKGKMILGDLVADLTGEMLHVSVHGEFETGDRTARQPPTWITDPNRQWHLGLVRFRLSNECCTALDLWHQEYSPQAVSGLSELRIPTEKVQLSRWQMNPIVSETRFAKKSKT